MVERDRHIQRVADHHHVRRPRIDDHAVEWKSRRLPSTPTGLRRCPRAPHSHRREDLRAVRRPEPQRSGNHDERQHFKKEFNPIHAYRYFVEWDPIGTPGCDQPVQRCWTFRNYLIPETDEVPDPVTCNGMSFKVDFGENRVFLKIPRTCLGNPKAGRLRLESGHQTSDGSYTDNAFSGRANDTGITDFIPAG